MQYIHLHNDSNYNNIWYALTFVSFVLSFLSIILGGTGLLFRFWHLMYDIKLTQLNQNDKWFRYIVNSMDSNNNNNNNIHLVIF